MKIKIPSPSLFPTTKQEILSQALAWSVPKWVAIDDQMIQALPVPEWHGDAGMSIKTGTLSVDEVALTIALNAINYQFWDLTATGEMTRYAYAGQVGAMGMRAAFEAAWKNPTSPLNQARQGKPLSTADILAMFGNIPNPESRCLILNEVFSSDNLDVLSKAWLSGAQSGVLSVKDAALAAERCPLAFGDAVLKKAQLAVSELWVKSQQAGMAVTSDLTAFADYQIPNVLRALGVLSYDSDLAQKIDAKQVLHVGSVEECAIRGASILAVEKLATHWGVPVAQVDHFLWTQRKLPTTPFHLTPTTLY